MRKLQIEYMGKPVDMEMLNVVLGCFNQDLTVKEVRNLINKR